VLLVLVQFHFWGAIKQLRCHSDCVAQALLPGTLARHSCLCPSVLLEDASTGKSAGATRVWSFRLQLGTQVHGSEWQIAAGFRDAYKSSLRKTVTTICYWPMGLPNRLGVQSFAVCRSLIVTSRSLEIRFANNGFVDTVCLPSIDFVQPVDLRARRDCHRRQCRDRRLRRRSD